MTLDWIPPDLSSGWLLVTLQSAFPTFTQLTYRGALPLKEGAHILSYVYQFQGGLLKEPTALLSEKGTAEIEIV